MWLFYSVPKEGEKIMKSFIEKHPFWFALFLTIIITVLGIVIVVAGRVIGLPQPALILTALVVSAIIPLGIIWRLGWWKDAGFVGITQNAYALAVPVLMTPFAVMLFGTVENGSAVVIFYVVAFFLTGLGEEALSRGLFVRVFLPHGKWQAVIYPALLFGFSHVSQVFGSGMGLSEILVIITNGIAFAILYGAVRLRINNIWPLIMIHTIWDLFFVLSGVAGPNAVRGLDDIPLPAFLVLWVVEIVSTVYLMNKPISATIDGKPVETKGKQFAAPAVDRQPAG
jgi:membrane protease YdiL (CAAX protease family)